MNKVIPVILLEYHLRSIEGIITSFGIRNIPIIGLSYQKKPIAYYSKFIKKKYVSPDIKYKKKYLEFLLSLPDKGVLVYSSDATAEFLSEFQDILQEKGFLINITDYKNFINGFYKDKLFEICVKNKIPSLETIVINSIEDLYTFFKKINGTIILKPTKLAGSRYVLIKKEDDIKKAYEVMRNLIFSDEFKHFDSKLIAQEYIQYNYNDLYCFESYYKTNSELFDYLTIRKIRPNINRDGSPGSRLFAGETIRNDFIEENSIKLLNLLSWKGFAHLDWMYSPKYNKYFLSEINPRLPGFSNFLTKVGFEIGWYYYAELAGVNLKKNKIRHSVYFEALRVPGDISNGIRSIIQGHIRLWDYLKSYLKIFSKNTNVCIDVFYKKDIVFTFVYWSKFILYLLKRPFRFLINKS